MIFLISILNIFILTLCDYDAESYAFSLLTIVFFNMSIGLVKLLKYEFVILITYIVYISCTIKIHFIKLFFIGVDTILPFVLTDQDIGMMIQVSLFVSVIVLLNSTLLLLLFHWFDFGKINLKISEDNEGVYKSSVIFVFFSFVILFLGLYFKVGFRGVITSLPFGVAGFIELLRNIGYYFIFYLVVKSFCQGKKEFKFTLLFFIYTAIMILSTSSRFYLVQTAFLMVCVFKYRYGIMRTIYSHWVTFSLLLISFIVIIPLTSAYRSAVVHLDASYTLSVYMSYFDDGLIGYVEKLIGFVIFRVSGVESGVPLFYIDNSESILDGIINEISGFTFVSYFTYKILGLSTLSNTAYTPGFFGESFMYGGYFGLSMFLTFWYVFLFLLSFLSRFFVRKKSLYIFFSASVMFYSFVILTEGGSIYHLVTLKRIPAFAFSLLLSFFLAKRFFIKNRKFNLVKV